MPSIPPRGYIYFILDRTAVAIKIGYSKDVKARLSALQVSSATKLELLGWMPGTVNDEQRLHQRFERQSGEWFTATVKLLKFIDEHASTTNEHKSIMERMQAEQPVAQPAIHHTTPVAAPVKPSQADFDLLDEITAKQTNARILDDMFNRDGKSSTDRTFLNDAHRIFSGLCVTTLAVTAFWFWRVAIIEPLFLAADAAFLIGPLCLLYIYGFLWAITYRYRNDRQAKKVQARAPNQQVIRARR